MPSFETVADYLKAQPPHAQKALRRVREIIRKALPRATEGISYQMPVYKLDGVMVLYFAGYRAFYSIYPASAKLVHMLGAELDGLVHHKATIRLPYERDVPVRLITRIAKLRAAEVVKQATAVPPKNRAPRRKAKRGRTRVTVE